MISRAFILALSVLLLLPVFVGGQKKATENVCLNKEVRKAKKLKCPDLKMAPPFDVVRDFQGGKPVLRAGNSIDSVGKGPAELRGKRVKARVMRAKQRVWKKGGGHITLKTGAALYFKSIPGQGRYWKFRDAARFELWRLNDQGERMELVERGPKQVYCLRDLKRTHPSSASPSSPVYPACSQVAGEKRVKLGTSVGWSDVYPASYHQQWIELDDVTHTGCYAYVHIADPKNGIWEMNENNNEASVVVHLTQGGDYNPGRCDGVRDVALPEEQSTDDTSVGPPDNNYPY